MVSTIDYPSFKELELRKQKPFNVLVAIILIFIVIAYKPKIMLFFILTAYLLSGPVVSMYRSQRRCVIANRHLNELPADDMNVIKEADATGAGG
jgi:CDP-diacylglycerol--serine O-phosphatidyltransferase